MTKKRLIESHQLDNLLTTKLEIPLLGARIVVRERLVKLLGDAVKRRVTLVTAPTGYGKTTLLVEWLAALQARDFQIVWISLDQYDNVPLRLWSYVVTGLKKVHPRLQYNLQRMVESGYGPHDLALLNPLLNEIGQVPFPLCLILDDYQAIRNPDVHRSLDYLIEHQPANLHLILSSRSTPPIPLSRLRAQRQLLEITARDLSFTLPEAKSFLSNVMELNVDAAQVDALLEATEGWIAGMQLAALFAQGGHVTGPLRADLLRNNRQILDYLIGEVLNDQSDEIKEFLLRTSILAELCAPLCDSILNLSDSRSILAQIEQANLFLVCLDEKQNWYRYHPLFAEALELQLKRTYPGLVPELHTRACDWLLENHYPEKAVSHALAAGNAEKAAEIVETYAMQAIIDYDINSLLQWIADFDQDLLARRPQLGIYYALANQHAGKAGLTESTLREVDQVLEDAAENGISPQEKRVLSWQASAIRAVRNHINGDMEGIRLFRSLLADRPQVDDYFDGYLHYALGEALDVVGDLDASVAAFDKGCACAVPRHKIEYVHARCEAGRVRKKQGRLSGAAEKYLDAIDFARRVSLDENILAIPQSGLMEIAVERNDLPAAQGLARQVLDHLAQHGSAPPLRMFFGNIATRLARFYLSIRDVEQAQSYYQQAVDFWEKLYGNHFPPPPDLVDLQVRLYQALAEQTADQKTDAASLMGFDPGNDQNVCNRIANRVALSRVSLARKDYTQARTILEMLDLTIPKDCYREKLIETRLLLGLVCQAQGDDAHAVQWIDQAVRLAQPEGYTRVFIDEGDEMRRLLQGYLAVVADRADGGAEAIHARFARQLVDNFDHVPWLTPQPAAEALPGAALLGTPIEPLSQREREVLDILLSGKSVKEIASALTISVNTAKVHIKNIYRKMGTHSRKVVFERAELLK